MNTVSRVSKIVLVAAVMGAVAAIAATKGDPSPFAKYGVVQVAGYDAGTGAPKCFGIATQNTVAVRNMIGDGGTTPTMYCGFDTSVTPITGFPVLAQELLSVDLVAVTTGIVAVIPSNLDGGATQTAGTATPQLCCIEAAGAVPSDLHWMIVK